ncbi:sensor histidine kinase [Enterococcus casseliflavus]|uniref:sensor histidine kinase n=1 Tax=Enterococcus TaxID=1350 RepID=UPI00115F2E89|nr:HAMP domain-containing sensor histidine kinase [Enterococcus casseliflavus]MDB1689534.1 HAMP domain-containing sensor histidine kinase [Enterococcus casseliflavus]MRI72077.1 HAMP domain-containing protein [Enterococcus casseliflavus]HJE17282.1 HAMP domain-containing histidine kinase [Enterococcus casseliflavus]
MKTSRLGFTYIKSKLLVRLWSANMLLVIIGIAFLWTVQILLFEPNYINVTKESLLETVQETAAAIEEMAVDPDDLPEEPLLFLSKTIVGTLFLVDEDGEILAAFNNGQQLNIDGLSNEYNWLLSHAPTVLDGESLSAVEDFEKSSAILIGVPTTLFQRPAALLLSNTITQIEALQSLNRQQLFLFTIILTIFASTISFFLAQHFIRPIKTIKEAIIRLTNGELYSVPKLKRSDELGTLSESVADLSTELQRVDVLRKEVIANVSHELRSPLALITGYGEMVRDVSGNDERLRKEHMDLIISEAHRMSAMVDDIMDFSIMQAGYTQLKNEIWNTYEVVSSVVAYARGIANQYDITVDFEADRTNGNALFDRIKMEQVLRNLINNGINHTPKNERLLIKLTNTSAGTKVAVINPGKDIPPEQLELIWERYQRVQHQAGHKEGTGIGLAIVKTILTSHAFEYGAESKNGVTCFWFVVPRLEDQ